MIKAVLFDLDGTLADTAPDLGYALNRLRLAYGLPEMPFEQIRPQASHGARGLLKLGFDLDPTDKYFMPMREAFLNYYEENLSRETKLFPGMARVLETLEERSLPWGIVTNKPRRFTEPLVEQIGLKQRAACVISGDTCAYPKPHPAPLLAASQIINVDPENCIYVGDDLRDVEAGLAAGMKVIIASYGYLGNDSDPANWGSHGMIKKPQDLIQYL